MYFTTRSEQTAQKARNTIEARNPGDSPGNIKWLLLDMSDLKSVSSAADELKKKEINVDILSRFRNHPL